MRILVAEDEPVSRELLRRYLESAPGHTGVLATDGAEAWAALSDRSRSFDAVLLDIELPKINGLELLARIRASERLKKIPVILCTATNDRNTVQRAAGLNVAGYFVKPFSREQVHAKLRQIAAMIPPPTAAPNQPPAPPPPWKKLGMDEFTYRSVLRIINTDLRDWVSRMKREPKGPDLDILSARMNRLTSACRWIGATRAARHLAAIESSLREPSKWNSPELASMIREPLDSLDAEAAAIARTGEAEPPPLPAAPPSKAGDKAPKPAAAKPAPEAPAAKPSAPAAEAKPPPAAENPAQPAQNAPAPAPPAAPPPPSSPAEDLDVTPATAQEEPKQAQVALPSDSVLRLTVAELQPGLVLVSAIATRDGLTLLRPGAELTEAMLQWIQDYSTHSPMMEPIVVRTMRSRRPVAQDEEIPAS